MFGAVEDGGSETDQCFFFRLIHQLQRQELKETACWCSTEINLIAEHSNSG